MLELIALPALLGIAAGYARGGRLRNLARFDVRAWWLLSLATALQVIRYRDVPGFHWLLGSYASLRPMLLVFGLVGLWLVINAVRARPERAGIVLIACGWLANLVVMGVNSGMPFDRDAALSVGFSTADVARTDVGDYHVLTSADHLGWLADIVPVPYLQRVASVGDILLVVGLMAVCAVAMRPRQATGGAVTLSTVTAR
jgi:hypothetical protein